MEAIQSERSAKSNDPLLSTGIAELDNILGGGLPRNHIYLVQGQPGVGKTTLALQYLIAGRDLGEKGLYITLSESKDDLISAGTSHGWNLDDIEIYEHWSTASAASESYHTLFHPDEVDLSETITDLLDVIDQLRPARIVFDSLSELKLLAADDLRYRRQIIALRDRFAVQHATVLLLDDKSVTENDLQIQSVVHGVFQLLESAPEYGPDRRRLRIAKLRGTNYASGFHDYKISTGGLQIYPRLVAADHRAGFTKGKIYSNVDQLDKMFGGGLDRGTTSLLLGPSGTGKSTVAALFAISAAQLGERAAVYTFDERISTLYERTTNLGLNFVGEVERGRISVTAIDPAELTPGEFVNLVRTAVERDRVTTVVLDSLSGYIHAMPDAKFLILQLHELLTFLGQKGVVTLIAVTQHGLLTSDAVSNLDVSYLSDNIMLFRYFERQGEVRVARSIFKRRSGQHERSIRELRMHDSNGISISDPLTNFQGIMTGVPIYNRNSDNLTRYEK